MQFLFGQISTGKLKCNLNYLTVEREINTVTTTYQKKLQHESSKFRVYNFNFGEVNEIYSSTSGKMQILVLTIGNWEMKNNN